VRLKPPRRGADNPAAKLTPYQANQIRAKYMTGQTTLRGLASENGVHHRVIWRIVNGQSYRDGD
jgi:hypothetical protein